MRGFMQWAIRVPAVLLVLALTGLQGANAGTIEDIQQRGKLIVGLSTFVPWAMRTKSGELIGFEIDVARKLAEDMGVDVEFQPTAFDGIIPALQAKKFDLIITGMTLKPKRNLSVNFTRPYAYLKVGMVANKAKSDKDGLKTLKDWNSAKVTLTIKRGTAPGDTAARLFPLAKVRQFDDDAQALQDVLNGNSHAFLTSEPKPTHAVMDNAKVLFQPFGAGPWDPSASSMAVRKGDPDAINFLDNWILFHELDGWLQQTHDKWFKSRDWKKLVD